MTDRKVLKADARGHVKTARPSALLVTLVFLLVSLIITYFNTRISSGNMSWKELQTWMLELAESSSDVTDYYDKFYEAMGRRQASVSSSGQLISLALRVVLVIFTAGFPIYSLKVMRQGSAELGSLFDGFGMAWKVYFLDFLKSIIIAVGFACLIVPGVVLSLALSQSLYLLLDHPDWSVGQCLLESARLTKGRRWEYLMLRLSFLLWDILSGIFVPLLLYVRPYEQFALAGWYNVHVPAVPKSDDYTDGTKPPWEY